MQNTPPSAAVAEREALERMIAPGPRAGVSVVIPAFNEVNAIGPQIDEVRQVLEVSGWPFEIIVVDDGSGDGTAEAVRAHAVRLVQLPYNRGYGAALKAGIATAQNEWIVITDADGTYPAEAIPRMLERAGEYDMVVGARTKGVNIPTMRRPAKWFLGKLASFLAEQPIPDLNSGLRVMRKSLVQKFEHLLPSGFSFTTTITLALLCNNFRIFYQPIDYLRRVGSSKIRPKHAYQFLMLILRTVVYFNPLRVFVPLGAVFFLPGLAKLIFDVAHVRVSQSAIIAMLGGIILWAIGMLADQVSRIALSLKSK
jgi:glycosyltransferase involved in cell wall biosynthesis